MTFLLYKIPILTGRELILVFPKYSVDRWIKTLKRTLTESSVLSVCHSISPKVEETKEEQGEEAEEEVVEEVDNLLAQMYNSSEGGLASALLQVVLEGRKEKEEEEEMMERCSREEERVYQVKRFFHFFYNLTRRPISVIHYVHQVALMTIAHIAVWPKAQSFSEANKPDCVHCLYR